MGGNWTFDGNTVNNCSYAFYVYGTTTASADTVNLVNNTLNITYYGTYFYYAKQQNITGNTINNAGTGSIYNYVYYPKYGANIKNNTLNDVYYGFYCYGMPTTATAETHWEVENNNINSRYIGLYFYGSTTTTSPNWNLIAKKNNIVITGSSTNYGIYLGYVNSSSTNPSYVENNMISCGSGTSTGTIYGLYSYHSGNVIAHHNSVYVTSGSATASRALYLNKSTSATYFSASGNEFKNNIVVNTGGGYALEVASAAATGYATLNYNNYYASGTTPFGPGSTTLSAWQTASSQDANSVWGDPLFVSATNLHVQGSSANNIGAALGVLTDIDGQTRSTTTPDMGADEYAPLTCFGASALNASSITNVGFTATWTSNNSTTIGSQIRYRIAGTTSYTVATGGAGNASLSGLTAGTVYDYSVREICSIGDTCSWSLDAQATTGLCSSFAQCSFTLNMTDSYGDGWNGALVGFQQKNAAGQWVTVGSLGSAFTT